MIEKATIAKAVELLRQAAPGATIILFGSYARGDHREQSDLDFLVVEPEVAARRSAANRDGAAARCAAPLADSG